MAKRILAGQDELVASWIAQRIQGFEYGATPFTGIGLVNESGNLIAGVLFENFTKADVHMHAAALPGRRWLNREFLGECFRYPFLQLGVARITGPVPSRNEDACRFDEHLGFKLEGRLRRMCKNGDDLLIYGMLREECRWLNTGVRHGSVPTVIAPRHDGAEHIRCAV